LRVWPRAGGAAPTDEGAGVACAQVRIQNDPMGFSRETRMKTVKKGISPKSDVYILQAFLKASGYAIETDGDFGAGTTAALQAFQRDNGLIVDGVAGPKTWSVLFAKHPDLLNRSSAKWLSEANIVDFGSARQLEV